MKLKKIASLALAGALAVSMLAGCGINETGKGDGEVVVGTASTSIVDAANDSQSATNKVKVEFTSNADLEAALKAALTKEGDGADSASVWTDIGKYTAETYGNNSNKADVSKVGMWDENVVPNDTTDIDGESKTYLMVFNIKANQALTETAAVKIAAENIDTQIAKLVTGSKETANSSSPKYYNYDYDASVVMVPAQQANGVTWYYVAVEFTQTATEATLEP